jgi:hypothetical protein
MSNVEKGLDLSNFEPVSALLPGESNVPLVDKSQQFILNTGCIFPENGISTSLDTY